MLTIVILILSWSSVIVLANVGRMIGKPLLAYFFVSDSNKVLALAMAVSAFMFFNNLHIKQSGIINAIGASTFGVLLIHANSDVMRKWLWEDVFENVSLYHSKWLMPHAIFAVIVIFGTCIVIDQLRIRFIEKPFFRRFDK